MSDKEKPEDFDQPTHYVGIGASAGGLEAIEGLVGGIPVDSGLAYVIIQHLSPDYKSMMVELLSKRTEMPVHRAEEGMLVQANRIYLIPPKTELTIFHGRLLLTEKDPHKSFNLPIDIFFISLAEDQGEQAVGIVLSGTGSDGTKGVRAIKEAAGMVMVQEPDSAKFDGMPKSAISTGVADIIATPEEMAMQLLQYVKSPYVTKVENSPRLLSDEEGLTRLYALLRNNSKVDFTFYKPNTVVRRIERRMSVNQIHELSDYVKLAESYPKELKLLYKDLLIGVTNFFRDPMAFGQLKEKWLPEVLKRRSDAEIRLWVCACSTGEEAYSLAILCTELLEDLNLKRSVKIFATDVDQDALVAASAGIYAESIVADISPRLLAKYFSKRDEQFQINRQIREMVVFAQHNILKDPPFTNIDLVSCRNMLIYLQPVLQRRAIEMFNFSLNAQGILYLGTSESTGDLSELFETLDQKWKIYRSRGHKRVLGISEGYVSRESGAGKTPLQRTLGIRQTRSYEEERTLDRFVSGISDSILPAGVIVNEQMELVHSFGNCEHFLKMPRGKAHLDVIKMAVHEVSIPMSSGLTKVFKGEPEIKFTNLRVPLADGTTEVIELIIRGLPGKKGQLALAAVFFKSVRNQKKTKSDSHKEGSASFDVSKETEERLFDLEQELQFSRENLQATIEELETSNEELQATNEELLASNEELQSTNEELQSVNEELYTVNTEHQRKIVELGELNQDMENLLSSAHIATIFLDEELNLRKYTALASEIVRIIESDIGRSFEDLAHNIVGKNPFSDLGEVLRSRKTVNREITVKSGKTFLMTFLPFEVSSEQYSGLILTFVDITALVDANKDFESAQERFHLAQRTVVMGSWDWDIVNNRLMWSDTIASLFGLDHIDESFTYSSFLALVHPEDRKEVEESVKRAFDDPTYVYDLDHRIVQPGGKIRYMNEVGEVHRDEKGEPQRMIGVVRDITKFKQQETSEAALEKRYQMLFEKMQEACALHEIIVDDAGKPVDYRFLEVNKAFEEILGLEREKVIGKPVTEVFPGIEKSEFNWIETYGTVALGGEPVRFKQYFEKANGWFQVSAYSPQENQFLTVFSLLE